MNYDLNSDDPDLTTTYDVCVVGIGIAGSYLLACSRKEKLPSGERESCLACLPQL